MVVDTPLLAVKEIWGGKGVVVGIEEGVEM
ncbi:MAG: hypothetical protein UT14_C0053G0018 [Candidatus Shapirobacteria bacterium GW2011_GWE1_38_92]|uniref:Uncharacterized protein n=1 Tax=Candidatus Shapirobacteria bacterium GW2011_GWE1_38_92 TaxID=1618489 RepID=A0A0G0LP60_9BACT|nr:MAG: hypothetical protein UT14_C0053G0018 [Candidatus Shapirobacteria bacterium GW2011_GWE1_38_92]